MIELIRKADVAFTNLEMLLHNYEDNTYPSESPGGTYTRADPIMTEELNWMGFDIVSTANNHSLDYMYGGLFKTIEHLNTAKIVHAGTGKNLAEARQPAYLDTSKGRVALIAASSSFAPFDRAGAARKDIQGRPGLNPQRFEIIHIVPNEILEQIKKITKEIGLTEVVQPDDVYYFLDKKFVAIKNVAKDHSNISSPMNAYDFMWNKGSDDASVGVHTEPHEGDMEGNLESIRDAARQADWVFFSLHAHEGMPNNRDQPAKFIEDFSRACIDAGAHVVIGHGHHAMRGIEIRDCRPIFYSLGNFIFQNQTIQKMPADFYELYELDPYHGTPADTYDARRNAPSKPGKPEFKWFSKEEKYWISILPIMTFKEDKLIELKLQPIELGQDKSRPQKSRPMLAEPKLAKKIFKIITKLSKHYGTKISVIDGVGFVDI